jgi:hypothetical protein
MAFRDLRNRLTASVDQLDRARLNARYHGLGLTPMGDAAPRIPIRVAGEVKEARVLPLPDSRALHVIVDDGTGRVEAVFSGRRRIGGLSLGRGVVLEGVGHEARGRLVLLNPAYNLLPVEGD